jgi:signal recognition particle subunit SRP54
MRKAWDIVRIDGKLSEDNIKAPMREIRRALLEADVALPVVRGFVKRVQDRALGIKVSLSTGMLHARQGRLQHGLRSVWHSCR